MNTPPVKPLVLSAGATICLLAVCIARESAFPAPSLTKPPVTQTQRTSAKAHSTRLKISGGIGWVSAMTLRTSYTLQVLDTKTGQPLTDFQTTPAGLMNVTMVSSNLSRFNHLQPKYQGNGNFSFPIVLPLTPHYKLYATYTPKGGTQEVVAHDLGQPQPGRSASLKADTDSNGGWLVKDVVAAPTGPIPSEKRLIATPQTQMEADAGPLFMNDGRRYQVALKTEPANPVAGEKTTFHFQVRDAKGQPIRDLEPYLGAAGQCVLLSADTKTYLHPSAQKGTTPSLSGFGSGVHFDVKFPKSGLYKVWGQFLHEKNKVITASFVLNIQSQPRA